MSFRCIVCRKGPMDGVTVHRVNAKGQPGIWACTRHIKQTDAPPIDPDVQRIVSAIEGRA
jgi:hypothetical protein